MTTFTQDAPEGNFRDLRAKEKIPEERKSKNAFLETCKDYRVWALFFVYASCFGIELTINNIAALYFVDYFDYIKEIDPVDAMKIPGRQLSCSGE